MTSNSMKKLVIAGVVGIIILILILALNPFTIVKPGTRGIVLNFGQPAEEVLDEGLHWRVPIKQKIVDINVQTNKYEVTALSYSKDLQTVDATVALNYHVIPAEANKLYIETGMDFQDRIISPSIQEIMKQVSSQYTAQELVEKRIEAKEELRTQLTNRLLPYHLAVDEVSIVNFDFSDAYEQAIEEKQVAEQNAEKAKNELDRIKIEADQTTTKAAADAEAIRIQAQALSENRDYVELKALDIESEAIKKWNGELPQYMLGDSVPFVNIDKNNKLNNQN